MREQHEPEAFSDVLAADEKPLVVGGQAVNLWAEYFTGQVPELAAYVPFDLDATKLPALTNFYRHRAEAAGQRPRA